MRQEHRCHVPVVQLLCPSKAPCLNTFYFHKTSRLDIVGFKENESYWIVLSYISPVRFTIFSPCQTWYSRNLNHKLNPILLGRLKQGFGAYKCVLDRYFCFNSGFTFVTKDKESTNYRYTKDSVFLTLVVRQEGKIPHILGSFCTTTQYLTIPTQNLSDPFIYIVSFHRTTFIIIHLIENPW